MHTTEAIVLATRPVGEADAVCVLYTRDFGKIRALAQGIKKEEAKLRGHCEPPNRVSAGFVIGKNGERLVYAQALESYPRIRGDLDCMKAAWRALALIDQQCFEGERDERLWSILEKTLSDLDENGLSDATISEFNAKVTAAFGYG